MEQLMQQAKNIHNQIPVPEELPTKVESAIYAAGSRHRRGRRFCKTAGCAVACCLVIFAVLINAIPAFAMGLYEVPLIGQVVRFITFWEYHKESETQYINAKIPVLENTGNTELEARINYEIAVKIDDILAEAEARAQEYWQAFTATGGQPEDFHPITIQIDYDVKHTSEEMLSFIIYKTETLAVAYTEVLTYNMDLETGKDLTLQNLLGPHCVDLMKKQIRQQIQKSAYRDTYFPEEGLSRLTQYQPFYLNSEGQVVVVFEKYEIAPGFMGLQEFTIVNE